MSVLSAALKAEVANAPTSTAVFELGGQSFNVGAKPLTAADFEAVNKSLPVQFQQDPTQFSGQVDMLIRKTRTVDDEGMMTGEKAFSAADRAELRRLDVTKVAGMFADLFGDQLVAADDEEEVIVDAGKP